MTPQTTFVYLELPDPGPALGVAERHVAPAEVLGGHLPVYAMCGIPAHHMKPGDETYTGIAATCEACQYAVRVANWPGHGQLIEL